MTGAIVPLAERLLDAFSAVIGRAEESRPLEWFQPSPSDPLLNASRLR